MSLITVVARTAEKDNTARGGSECKFYRTYEFPTFGVSQWGSQRDGRRSGGQFKITPGPISALEAFERKLRDGYVAVGGEIHLQVSKETVDAQLAKSAAAVGEYLNSAFTFAAPVRPATPTSTTPTSATPDPAEADPAPQDRIAATNERALSAIALAATDPAKALTEYALLTGEVEELETNMRKIRSYLSTLEILVDEAL